MNLTHLFFERPWWFLAIIALVWFIFTSFYQTVRHSQWEKVCDKKLLPFVLEKPAKGQNIWQSIMTLIAGLLLITALAGPSWKENKNPALVNESALVIALDLSRSMLATDVKPSRLQRAKFKIEDILKKRKEGMTALIVYAGEAFTVTPLTGDTKTILAQLPILVPSIMPVQGNHPEEAIDKAIDLLKQANQPKGNILLVTDELNGDVDLKAAQTARNKGYLVSVLAIGTKQGAPVPYRGSFITNQRGQMVIAKINPDKMKAVAHSGGGLFYEMKSDNSDVEALSRLFDETVNSIKKTTDDLKVDSRVQEGPWFVLASLLFIALIFRKKQMNYKALALLLVVPFLHTQNAKASEFEELFLNKNQIAKQKFDKGNYEESTKLFTEPKWKQAAEYKSGNYKQALQDSKDLKTSDDWYNRGNILARLGKIDEAIASYEKAIKLDVNNEDAVYNKKLLEQQKKKQQKNKKNKKDNKKNQKDNKKQSKDKNGKGKNSKDSNDKKKNKDQKNKQKKDQKQKSSKNNQNKKQKDKDKKNADSQQQKMSDEERKKRQQQEKKRKELEKKDKEQQKKEQKKQKSRQQSKQKQQKSEEEKRKLAVQARKMKPNEKDEEKKQWLRRIPDDPSLLWKRKFLYQYKNSSKRPRNTGEKQW